MVDPYSFFTKTTKVYSLPSQRKSKLLICGNSFSERWERCGLLPVSTFKGELKRFALRFLCATGMMPSQLGKAEKEILDSLVENKGQEWNVSACIIRGNEAFAKNTLLITDQHHHPVGYLKYVEKLSDQKNLENEYRCLSILPPGIAPKVIKYGLYNSGTILFTQPIPGRVFNVSKGDTIKADQFLRKMNSVERSCDFMKHPWIMKLKKRTGDALDWAGVLTKQNWSVVIFHGDFVPWNLFETKNGKIVAIDWEYGDCEGFPYIDKIYYALQVDALIRQLTPQEAFLHAQKGIMDFDHSIPADTAKALIGLTALYGIWQRKEDRFFSGDYVYDWRTEVFEIARN